MCLSGLCISFQETASVFICVFVIGLSLRSRQALKAARKQYPSTADCCIRERVYKRAEIKKTICLLCSACQSQLSVFAGDSFEVARLGCSAVLLMRRRVSREMCCLFVSPVGLLCCACMCCVVCYNCVWPCIDMPLGAIVPKDVRTSMYRPFMQP